MISSRILLTLLVGSGGCATAPAQPGVQETPPDLDQLRIEARVEQRSDPFVA